MNSVTRLRQLALLVMLMTVTLAGLYWWRLAASHAQWRTDALTQTSQRATQLSDAVGQQMDALMHAVDFAVVQLRDQYAAGNAAAFEATVRSALDSFPAGSLLQVGVIDADGYLSYSNLGVKGRIYLGDREHFKAHLGGADRLFISKPVFGRASKTWSVQFTRPILRQGKFQGVMVVSLAPEYVAATLAQLRIAPSDALTMLYIDGAYMARVPDTQAAFGKSVPAERPFVGPQTPAHGVVRITATFDQVRRTLAWNRMEHFPFVVTVSLGEDAILAPVEEEIARNLRYNGAGVALVVLLGAGMAWLLMRIARQQQTLAESEDLHRTLFETIAGGIMVMEPGGRITAWNSAALEIMGVDANGLQNRTARILDANGEPLPKERYPSLRAARGEILVQELIQVEPADGKERRWVTVSSSPLQRSSDGASLGAVISFADITRLMAAEESLRLAQSVFESAGEGIMVTDTGNKIVAVNPAFTRITGYRADEVIGQDPSLLNSGEHDATFYRTMWQRLLADGHWEGEIRNRRRDGRNYVEWLKIDVIRDNQGAPRRYVALFSDVTERKRQEEIVWRQANFDTLTGLPNRQLLEDRLGRVIAQAHRAHTQVALLFIDLDRFKPVNDRYGHAAGDDLLRQVAHRLENTLRDEDTIARLGGDEFIAVMPDVRSADGVGKTAAKIVDVLSEPFRVGEHIVEISCCVGVALFPKDADDTDTLIEKADAAMYRAKEEGRATWRSA